MYVLTSLLYIDEYKLMLTNEWYNQWYYIMNLIWGEI